MCESELIDYVQESDDKNVDPGGNYVDDTLFYVSDPDAHSCAVKLATVVAISVDVFAFHGLLLNFDKGKNACMFSFRGSNAKNERKRIMMDELPTLCTQTASCGFVRVHIVSEYKYLGDIVDFNGNMLPTIAGRTDAAMSAYFDNRSFLKSNRTSVKSKKLVVSSMCMSRMLYNAGTWYSLSPTCYSRLHTKYSKMYRTVFAKSNNDEQHVSDKDFF